VSLVYNYHLFILLPFKTLRERLCVTPKKDNILPMNSWGITISLQ